MHTSVPKVAALTAALAKAQGELSLRDASAAEHEAIVAALHQQVSSEAVLYLPNCVASPSCGTRLIGWLADWLVDWLIG